MPCGISYCSHNSGRSRQHKSAGAENNKDCDGSDDLSCKYPCKGGCRESDNHDPCCPSVGNSYDLCLIRISRLDKSDHPLNGAVFSDLRCLHLKCTELINCSAGYFITNGFIDGERLAGHNCLIDGCLPGQYDTINRNRLTGEYTNHVINLHFFCRDDLFGSVLQNTSGLRCEVNELFNSCSGSCNRQIFKKCAELHDESNFSGCEVFMDTNGCD